MNEVLEEERPVVVINGGPSNNIQYADDALLLAQTVQRIVQKVYSTASSYS